MSIWIELVQTIMLTILVDRSIILRSRYKIRIELIKGEYSGFYKNGAFYKYIFRVAIVCKEIGSEFYSNVGKNIILIHFKKKL